MIRLVVKGKRRLADKTHSVTNIITKGVSKKASVALVHAKNHTATTKNVRSDRIYYVPEGMLKVRSGKRTYVARHGNAIFIPRNTLYTSSGTFKAIIILHSSENRRL